MNRRTFLKTLLASAALANTISVAAGTVVELKPELFSWKVGYDRMENKTWLRVSYILPDGKEWYDLIERTGGDYTDENGVALMWRAHEIVMARWLRLNT